MLSRLSRKSPIMNQNLSWTSIHAVLCEQRPVRNAAATQKQSLALYNIRVTLTAATSADTMILIVCLPPATPANTFQLQSTALNPVVLVVPYMLQLPLLQTIQPTPLLAFNNAPTTHRPLKRTLRQAKSPALFNALLGNLLLGNRFYIHYLTDTMLLMKILLTLLLHCQSRQSHPKTERRSVNPNVMLSMS